jgi:hypothetical protein
MRQMIYSMCFTGRAAAADTGSPTVLKAVTTGSSNRLITMIGSDGVSATANQIEGGKAFFESKVSFTGATTFEESGSIRFGDENHRLHFSTVGAGYLANSADPKLKHGSIIWRIDGGEGQFAQSTGLITSNFTVSDAGEVVDHQFGLIFLK